MSVAVFSNGGIVRPAPQMRPPLPPFDTSDPGGIVHTTAPPEFQPPTTYDPLFFRADFTGLTINLSKWPGLNIPMLIGANSTPINMLMSPMLILYPRAVQDTYLTEACWRNYSHIVIAPDGWNLQANGLNPTPQNIVTWAKYLKSWGFFVVLWRSQPTSPDPFYRAMLTARCVDFYIIGEEIDSKLTAEQLPPILDRALQDCNSTIPIGVHFTANYPLGFPRDTFLTDWSPYNGRVHLCWQADYNDPAGTQGAKLFYARQRVQLGWVGEGSYSNPAPLSRVIAFEQQASAQLQGQCDESYGNLRSLEMMYCPNGGNPGIGMVSGFGNGARYSNGMYI